VDAENPVALPLWCGLSPGLNELTLVEWQPVHAGLLPRWGSAPCVLGVRYCFWMLFHRWHCCAQAEPGEDSVDVSWPGAWHDQQVMRG
jgi:hypothetical protein